MKYDRQKAYRHARLAALCIAHVTLFTLSYWIGYLLRFDFAVPVKDVRLFWTTLPLMIGVKLTVFYLTGNFHGRVRYVTFYDLIVLLKAAVVSLLLLTAVDEYLLRQYQIPRSVLLMDFVMTIMFLGMALSSWRFIQESVLPVLTLRRNGKATRALIVQTGMQAEPLVRQILADPNVNYRIVGFLDPEPAELGGRIGGTPVLGLPEEAVRIAREHSVEEILVMAGNLSGVQLRALMEQCRQAKIQIRVLPSTDHMLSGDHRLIVRDVDINDLLRRDPVQLDSTAIGTLIEDKVVMVTGAGGSIGSEICRQVLKFHPKTIVMVERMENNLFVIDRELDAIRGEVEIRPCIADITDKRRMRRLFREYQPSVVFHAAAHKHVPMMEMNCGEAIKNNILGTKRVADLADQFGVERFVLISTDKAVNPTSVMGVSKHLAERYVHAKSQTAVTTKFVVVRFGNVLASAGSVVPIFQEQIRRGGPITVTHPEMRRFFMTIPEASQLVIQAGAMGKGGEIFVLDMGEPVKISDLAADLIRLSGLSPDDIEIVYSGTRPGEKLYEELYFDEEQTLPTPHKKLRVAYHRPFTLEDVMQSFKELWRLRNTRESRVRRKLKEIVPEYQLKEEAQVEQPASVPPQTAS
ncbi:MAG: nucleoside-diphosphate sugar epimerase/dehydratase [Planctomycetales bacterium]